MEFLNFTLEIPEDFPGMKLQTLDMKIWIVAGNKVLYEFYEKPMAANVVVQAGSALGESVKVATLTEEVIRRLKHTSRSLPHSSRLEVLEDLAQKMSNSGHRNAFMTRNTNLCTNHLATPCQDSEGRCWPGRSGSRRRRGRMERM